MTYWTPAIVEDACTFRKDIAIGKGKKERIGRWDSWYFVYIPHVGIDGLLKLNTGFLRGINDFITFLESNCYFVWEEWSMADVQTLFDFANDLSVPYLTDRLNSLKIKKPIA